MKHFLAVCAVVTLGLSSVEAQTSSDAALQALLTEVRQLRLALERSAVVSPKIQMTLQRMQLQQDAVARASRELEDVRNQLSRFAAEREHMSAELAGTEARIAREQDVVQRKGLEENAKRLKGMLEERASQTGESQWRARESEMAGRLATEQGKLSELNERLNVLERSLEAPQPTKP